MNTLATAFATILAAALAIPPAAQAPAPRTIPIPALPGVAVSAGEEVDTILVLAVDISQSMDEDEQRVQRQGYVDGITSPEFIAAVEAGMLGKIALTFVEWGGVNEQFVVVPWRMIAGEDDAVAFADDLAAVPLRTVQRTSISAALTFSAELIEASGYTSYRKVIDISGDGPNNQGPAVVDARDAAVEAGITINGLPLMMKSGGSWYYLPNLDHYYEDCVIGGPLAFVEPVRSISEFSGAIRRKLVNEIAWIQSPKVVRAAARPPVQCNLYD